MVSIIRKQLITRIHMVDYATNHEIRVEKNLQFLKGLFNIYLILKK